MVFASKLTKKNPVADANRSKTWRCKRNPITIPMISPSISVFKNYYPIYLEKPNRITIYAQKPSISPRVLLIDQYDYSFYSREEKGNHHRPAVQRVGLPSRSSFCRQFKQIKGITPKIHHSTDGYFPAPDHGRPMTGYATKKRTENIGSTRDIRYLCNFLREKSSLN